MVGGAMSKTRDRTLTGMNNSYDTPAGSYGSTPAGTPEPSRPRHKRLFRWGTGITLAGFLAGGGIALAATGGGTRPRRPTVVEPAQGADTELGAQHRGQHVGSGPGAPGSGRRWAGCAGSAASTAKSPSTTGRATARWRSSAARSSRSAAATSWSRRPTARLWTWTIVSDTVVRQSGARPRRARCRPVRLVFAGGPVVNGAKDARLIVIRAPKSGSSRALLLDLIRPRHR
jgi:hypothetical protein